MTVLNTLTFAKYSVPNNADVENVDALPAMLQTVRHAVADGELDELLAKYAEYGRSVRKRTK